MSINYLKMEVECDDCGKEKLIRYVYNYDNQDIEIEDLLKPEGWVRLSWGETYCTVCKKNHKENW
jgi:hypothetical protein